MDLNHGPHPAYGAGMTTTTTEIPVRLDFETQAKTFYSAMAHLDKAATKELDKVDFDPKLRELVRLRASQINGCAYCVDTHSRDARAIGETEQRLYAVAVWEETPFFDARERAALALTETITRLPDTHVPAEAYAAAAEHFSEAEMGALISLITVINAWNAIAVTTRAWEPGSYDG
jgi:AhpD family alkylhydroperoxidase